jgi:hypothetical protein
VLQYMMINFHRHEFKLTTHNYLKFPMSYQVIYCFVFVSQHDMVSFFV